MISLQKEIPNIIDEHMTNSINGKKSCRTITLTCWVTTITATIILIDYILTWIKNLSDNERVWEQASKLLKMWNNSSKLC